MEKQVQETLETLSPMERKVIPSLGKKIKEIENITNLDSTSVNRALQFLANKKIVELKTKISNSIELDVNGIDYQKKGLPERRLLSLLLEKPLTLEEAKKESGLSENEFQAALGTLKSKSMIKMEAQISVQVSKEEAIRKFPEEKFLESLPLEPKILDNEQKKIYEKLRLRKNIVFIEEKKEISYEITDFGRKIIENLDKVENMLEQLTPEMIKDEKWKGKKFRTYDLETKAPNLFGGRRHPYLTFLQKIRYELASLGFEESKGPLVELGFWNCDALFMPQDHPAKGIHDLYFTIPEKGDLFDKNLLKKIKATHEHGWKTGSDGWQIPFDINESKKLVLRSQGTAVSARILASNPKIPGKYFVIARCFRPDVIDSKHLPEFNHLEGIIIDKNVDFSQLLGMLKIFAEKIAKVKQIKFLPSYFPFTEPSVELIGLHPTKGWIELGGAGVFRPEVTMPLGISPDTKVLAWGLGIDRLYMINKNLEDIRDIFSQDINFLRNSKI
jgi:phenylalanyl-tRNA synthetase alpha chain